MKPKFLNHLINLFYPQVCAACGNLLMLNEENVCLSCRYLLPKTEYEKNADNPLAQMFYGQVDFHAVTAEFFFSKTGKVQHLLHQLKYEGNQDAGFFLGQQLGESIKDAELFRGIDFIIPIPQETTRASFPTLKARFSPSGSCRIRDFCVALAAHTARLCPSG